MESYGTMSWLNVALGVARKWWPAKSSVTAWSLHDTMASVDESSGSSGSILFGSVVAHFVALTVLYALLTLVHRRARPLTGTECPKRGEAFKRADTLFKMLAYGIMAAAEAALILGRCRELMMGGAEALFGSRLDGLNDDTALVELYGMQVAHYVHSLAAFAVLHRAHMARKDWRQELAHHGITLFLLGMSWRQRQMRIGFAVFSLLDVCDVFLNAAKYAGYVGAERAKTAAFVVFVTAWVALRLLAYPALVLAPIVTGAPSIMQRDGMMWNSTIYASCLVGLVALWIIQWYWTVLIARVAARALSSADGSITDVREDDVAGKGESVSNGKKAD